MQSEERGENVAVARHRAIKRCQLCEQAKSARCVGPCALRDVHAQMSRASDREDER
jgi:hypothetical protein